MATIAIQAGGRSSRLGRDKALVEIDGITLIERVLQNVRALSDDIILTSNRPAHLDHLGYPIFADEHPGAGALEGLHTALTHAQQPYVLVLACDLPFLSQPLLRHQLKLAQQADVILPRQGEHCEPLHAVYRRAACLPPLRVARAEGRKRVQHIWRTLRVHHVEGAVLRELDPYGLSFFNINTRSDLQRAEAILRRGGL